MEILQLRYFLATAKLEQMTKAAEQLNIAQPSLSKTISRLEEQIGVPLFDRNGRNIRLNAYGQAFLKRVENVFTELEEAERELRDMAGLDRGQITLAVSLTNLLPEMLGAFLEIHPDIQFHQVVEPVAVMQRMLERGEIDMCLTFAELEGEHFESKTLRTEDIYLLVPDDHVFYGRESVSLHELKDENFIGLRQIFWFRLMTDRLVLRKAGFTPRTTIEVDEVDAVLMLIKQGHGVAFSPDLAWRTRMDLSRNRIKVTGLDGKVSTKLIWSNKHYLSAAAQKFREFIIEYFANLNW